MKTKILILILLLCSGIIVFFVFSRNSAVAEYNNLKQTYGNKKWHGTVTGEETVDSPLGRVVNSYFLRIENMWINFNAPESNSFSLLYPGAPRISIDGDAVMESVNRKFPGLGKEKIELANVPFKLDGTINFEEGRIFLTAQNPESEKMFKVLIILDDPKIPPFYTDDESLFDLLSPQETTFKFENGKVIFTGEINGVLEPF